MARLLSLEELKEYKTKDYLLWWESKDDEKIIPFTIYSPSQNIYCHFVEALSGRDYVEFGGNWMARDTYGKIWRCWECKPTAEQLGETSW